MDIPLTIYIPTKTNTNSSSHHEQEDGMVPPPPQFERWSSDCSNPSSRGCAANPPIRPQRNSDKESLIDDDDDDDEPCICGKFKSADTAPKKPKRCCESSPQLCTSPDQGLSLRNAFCLSRGIPIPKVMPTWSMQTSNTK